MLGKCTRRLRGLHRFESFGHWDDMVECGDELKGIEIIKFRNEYTGLDNTLLFYKS